jgi:EAL domain-containing protein (putative c-di-GMP-specific phosphodiesterase class I)
VVIELTERSRVPAAVLRREVASARRAGFRIAIDDAGAGATGFECLRAVDPDLIKIDRSVIASAGEQVDARATLVAILAYAAVTGAEVIGEGIEDQAMLDLLRDPVRQDFHPVRVRGVQGYLFGRPAVQPTEPSFVPR